MRSVTEWHGDTDDTPIPSRVKVRIFEQYKGQCCICGLSIRGRLLPAYDHRISLINGGENRESNIQLLCTECHKVKTRSDVREKSMVYRKKAKHLGIYKSKHKIPGSKGSGFRRKMDGTVWREKP